MGVQMPLALKAENRNELENGSYLAICPGQMFDISKGKTSKMKTPEEKLLTGTIAMEKFNLHYS